MTAFKKSLFCWLFWVVLACFFNLGVYYIYGLEKALEFAAGYLLEQSLSIDNLFVFLLIFSYFKVHPDNQHRILYWGIFGALVLRAAFIFGGVFLIQYFSWLFYVFGIILLLTSIKLVFHKEDNDLSKNWVLRICKKILPITSNYVGSSFITKEHGKFVFAPALLVLVMVEFSDIIFAMDSLPAIFAITLDPLIIYSSNLFAILGLRSLYFVLGQAMSMFEYLKYGIVIILGFVGIKILIKDFYHVPILLTLSFIISIMIIAILFSVIKNKLKGKTCEQP